MKWILFSLFLFISAGFLGLWYLQDPGNITITWLGYEIQFSIVSLFVFFIILFLLIITVFIFFYMLKSVCRYFFSLCKRKQPKEKVNEPN